MIKFFRKIRQKLLSENKLKRYLVYAFGEIILVVIGILIALQINNWNEQRKEHQKIAKIYERLILDIENDINDLAVRIEGYKANEHLYRKVMNDSVSTDLLDEGLSRIVANIPFSSKLRNTGIAQLKQANLSDPFIQTMISRYGDLDERKTNYETRIEALSQELIKHIRDEYPWYTEWISKKIMKDNSSPELQAFFVNSMEYRNFVTHSYNLIYNNYIRIIEDTIDFLHKTRVELKRELNPQFVILDEKKLLDFAGSYEMVEIDCPIVPDLEVGMKLPVEINSNTLKFKDERFDISMYLYHELGDTFYEPRFINAFFYFERDNNDSIVGLKIQTKSSEERCNIELQKIN
ncbi:DUF6090 family protein [Hyunsoonleella rubra]|uniref:DUF6090 family protein n=1 Tax=Hyunsoonleella rubra TaxID=1737062 RepID=A0ABW5TDR0_9FLAO